MRIEKPLWHEGLILTQQHFQQQDRWNEFALRQVATAALAQPWGTLAVEVDEDALASGRFKLTRLKLRFPDGTPIDTTLAQALPPARDLLEGVGANRQSVTVLAALALPDANGSNCRMDETALTRPRRSYREFVKVVDLNGSDEAEIAAERHALRLLFDFEPHADDTVCAIARLSRSTSGQFQLVSQYVPPCLTLGAHALHMERINRLTDILLAKSLALGARRSERVDQVTEYGVADVQLFWLLHCIHAAWPKLRFLASNPNQPPERLYAIIAELASALMTFSTGSQLTDIPLYDHARADEVFTELEALIRQLLDAIIPSRVVSIGLSRDNATTWSGKIMDERIASDAADWYLSVNSSLPAFELVERIPRLCKIGAPDDVEHIVNSALAGIALKPVQRVPSAIPVRLDNHYFALDAASPAHARLLAARACQIYLPSSVPDAALELYAVLRA
ncbi:type VI secretion system baseplate subunit TssK [Caballeronia sp. LP006]|jgi:type VI secretion system protein ImpJ|uniref:type VI secretion system baseplate subunit TssK n=1 Tax=unclassified Caballeronia TaxID=2646786 RepID=UPI00202963D8|nr:MULTISPECIES: type VI secretion system baseplate subunit TssK [unclassified Caballeronia]MDR5774843.1 type VI secretion system baseplate subunit TssK [Caballeronia sp. LZ002]MDR5799554.1 type VI secretion system baseplate subunit TssK [Caballeronia sp. LZ001]MDR5827228.1 type VI secretion system baseplate subunit TssK [Caballeronia sp. LP006]MDR5850279.1 type VI secretion system baseplate subunit TssK [Caballeronia sp. LZ003]